MVDTDWGDLYLQHVDAVSALASGLSQDQLTQVVPGTPQWTAHDVLRHLAGGPADGIAGRTEGAPGPAWTQRHVDERRDVGAAEVVEELRGNASATAESARTAKIPAVVWDIAVHHADLHEAFDRGRPPEHYWEPIVGALRSKVPTALADVDDYEIFRALFSRRSRRQMRSWSADVDGEALDEMCIFGARDDDQPVPTA